ncbi:fumarylacetoacetate hydrolase family protein [Paraburkholderia metrosideri]|uniref:Fumarylacetoacetate hydrolase family protein n=1 Tax=Paraburkholderia metrosideri TaxID=580937 RepID=A0ABW9E0M7_9BURK
MKLVSYNGGRLGVLLPHGVIEITDLCRLPIDFWPPVGMTSIIADFPRYLEEISRRILESVPLPVEQIRLEAPLAYPGNIVAFPANFESHRGEMKSPYSASSRGFFLKATSSIVGPEDVIMLPNIPLREIHHECEFGIVIGRECRGVSRENAMTHVFGYCCLVDVTVRGTEERVMRKSYDSFTPIGPWIVTADEVKNPHAMALELSVNHELRQDANTRDLIVDIPGMISMASSVMTLRPGDIIASGTPAGVGPLRAGDFVRIAVEGVGSMSLKVEQSKIGMNDAFAAGNIVKGRNGDAI